MATYLERARGVPIVHEIDVVICIACGMAVDMLQSLPAGPSPR